MTDQNPNPNPNPDPNPDPNPNPGGGAWFDSFEPELKGYLQNKGFKEPKDLAISYRNLEKLQGVPAERLLKLPDESDAEGWKQVWRRLGAPEKPEDYQIEAKDGAAGEFLKAATGWFHELGIPKKAAQALIQKMDEFGAAQKARQAEAQKAERAEQMDNLKRNWGAAYDKNFQIIDRVAEEFGMDDKALMALRDAMGPAKAAEFLYGIGKKLGEDQYVSSDGSRVNSFGDAMTPAQARDAINALRQDKDFVQRLINGDIEARKRWDRLHIWMAGSQAD